jgi:GTP cyclohydrolase FolE2
MEREDVPVTVADPFRPDEHCNVNCRVSLATEVPADRLGIHMSRLSHLVAASIMRTYPTLDDYAVALARAVGEGQYGGCTQVTVKGVLSFYETVAGRSMRPGKLSLEQTDLHASAVIRGGEVSRSSGIGFYHLTACPCVQEVLKSARSLGGDGRTADEAMPLLTHSQRCRSDVWVHGIPGTVPHGKLLDAFDRVIFRTQNTLPREQELALVYRAHRSPQFIEDAARDLLRATYSVVGKDPGCRTIEVCLRSMESIHSYDIFVRSIATAEELCARVGGER